MHREISRGEEKIWCKGFLLCISIHETLIHSEFMSCRFVSHVALSSSAYISQNRAKAESLLYAANIILSPVPLCDFFLANRNTAPRNPHNRNIIHIILIKRDLKTRIMSFWPLIKSPALNNLCRFNQLEIFTCNVTTEELELAAFLGAFEEFWCCSSEG